MAGIDTGAVISIISAIIGTIGAIVTLIKVRPEAGKIKSETRKNDADSVSSIAEAAESIVTGAKVSNDFLLQRMAEMVKRERERDEKINQLEQTIADMREKYEKELTAWQDWAKRLSHQVISMGGTPVLFKPKQAESWKPHEGMK